MELGALGVNGRQGGCCPAARGHPRDLRWMARRQEAQGRGPKVHALLL